MYSFLPPSRRISHPFPSTVSTNVVKKEVIKELNIDNISKIDDTSSELDSDLGSDLDLDNFEKSLREEYSIET